MRIAIYHNLQEGGALTYIRELVKALSVDHTICIYGHSKYFKNSSQITEYVFPLKQTSNVLEHLLQIFTELPQINKLVAAKINEGNYDLIIIGQCILTQSPYILRYINKSKISFYLLHEPKREFYERTSFDHFSIKRTLLRILRYPIKLIDLNNCSYSNVIISNSYYSSSLIQKIYKRKSFVIYPALKTHPLIKKTVNILERKFVSIGSLSYIKGHHLSIEQLVMTKSELDVIGRATPEIEIIHNLAKNNNVNLKIINCPSDKAKMKLLKKYNLYLSNNFLEPFGIVTLEGSSQNLYVLGTNEGGTPEIITSGIDGFLYPRNIQLSRNLLKYVLKRGKITLFTKNEISWRYTVQKLLSLYHHLTNTPNE